MLNTNKITQKIGTCSAYITENYDGVRKPPVLYKPKSVHYILQAKDFELISVEVAELKFGTDPLPFQVPAMRSNLDVQFILTKAVEATAPYLPPPDPNLTQ